MQIDKYKNTSMFSKKLFGSVILILFSLLLYSQAAERCIVNTAGDIFSNESISIEFSIGDIAIETLESEQLTLTQGFIQPDNYATNNIKQPTNELSWTIHPNPAKEKFRLIFDHFQPGNNQKVCIYDLNGRLIIQKDRLLQSNIINIEKLKPGTYFVNAYINELQNSKTYKLQVIN